MLREEISNFIKTISGKGLGSGLRERNRDPFSPEPNAYLHLGHARALVMNFELAKYSNGRTNLRFDDTNPSKEEAEFVEAIIRDVEWLGYKPYKNHFRIGLFRKQKFQYAVKLIKKRPGLRR